MAQGWGLQIVGQSVWGGQVEPSKESCGVESIQGDHSLNHYNCMKNEVVATDGTGAPDNVPFVVFSPFYLLRKSQTAYSASIA